MLQISALVEHKISFSRKREPKMPAQRIEAGRFAS